MGAAKYVKAIGWLVIIGVLGGAVALMYWGMAADPTFNVGYAISEKKSNGKHDLEIPIFIMMKMKDEPDYDVRGRLMWDDWLKNHFVVTDDAGNVIPMKKGPLSTKTIPKSKTDMAEFIAIAEIDSGKEFTITYQPMLFEPEKYTKTVLAQPKPFLREAFKEVK